MKVYQVDYESMQECYVLLTECRRMLNNLKQRLKGDPLEQNSVRFIKAMLTAVGNNLDPCNCALVDELVNDNPQPEREE